MAIYCPRCGQEQVSDETRFCSRCGFLMTGVFDLLATGGVTAITQTADSSVDSPRKRGLKQGLFMFLLTFLVVPLISILTVWANAEPFAVVISAILLSVGGLLRVAYAWLFESNVATIRSEDGRLQVAGGPKPVAISGQQTVTAENYLPPQPANWRDTNDLAQPSVTDSTTKLLKKDQ